MTSQQLTHVEEQLIKFIDRVVKEEKKATPAEIAALPKVASALAQIHAL